MTEYTKTEEELADDIYQKVDQLNILIGEATKRQVIVTFEIHDISTFGGNLQTYRIQVEISKQFNRQYIGQQN